MKIFKQRLQITNFRRIQIQKNAEILHAGMQDDHLHIWYSCDPSEEMHYREMRVYGTGHEMAKGQGRYIDTVHDDSPAGNFVWHVFEEPRAQKINC